MDENRQNYKKKKSILNISENFCTINSIEGMWGINKS